MDRSTNVEGRGHRRPGRDHRGARHTLVPGPSAALHRPGPVRPGLLTLTNLATARSPRVGYTARVLTVIGIGGTAAIFVAELLAGRLGSVGAAATEDFLATMFSGPIAGPVIPVALAFFIGAAVFAVPFIARPGPLRWPAVVLLAGVLLVLAEIISSQVLLSQIGSLLIWIGSIAFARLVVRGEAGAQAQAGRGMAETPWFPGCWPRPRLLVCSVSEPSHQGAPR
jgi:hypothetical protein